MKKIFLTIFALCAVISIVLLTVSAKDVWNGSVASGFEGGNGTNDDPYIIKTAEQLAYLSVAVKNGKNYSGKFIKLANDIVLNEEKMFAYDKNGVITGAAKGKTPNEWTAIGNSEYYFSGTFDGDGHEIKGIYINKSNKDYLGLFGYCQKATIKNVG
ncbi:MAG: hypothetical protein K6D98_05090, partial [Clostridiales bacterium]|nr:hypothetical protein [Clostridiales bacterium]